MGSAQGAICGAGKRDSGFSLPWNKHLPVCYRYLLPWDLIFNNTLRECVFFTLLFNEIICEWVIEGDVFVLNRMKLEPAFACNKYTKHFRFHEKLCFERIINPSIMNIFFVKVYSVLI